jgi:hypothetical protein
MQCVLARLSARCLSCRCRDVPARAARGHPVCECSSCACAPGARSYVMRGSNCVPLHAPRAAGVQRGNRPRARPVCLSARSGVSASSATRGHIHPTDFTMGSAPGALARCPAGPWQRQQGCHGCSNIASRSISRNPAIAGQSSIRLRSGAKFVPRPDVTRPSSPRPRPACVRGRPVAGCSR